MIVQAYHVISKDIEKVTQLLTSHVGQVMELLFFEAGNVAETRIAFWMCSYCSFVNCHNCMRYREGEMLLKCFWWVTSLVLAATCPPGATFCCLFVKNLQTQRYLISPGIYNSRGEMYLQHKLRLLTKVSTGNGDLHGKRILKGVRDVNFDKQMSGSSWKELLQSCLYTM